MIGKSGEFLNGIVGTLTSGPVTLLLLLSTPSMVKLFVARPLTAHRGAGASTNASAGTHARLQRARFKTPNPMQRRAGRL